MAKFDDIQLTYEYTDSRGLVRTTSDESVARKHYLNKFTYKATIYPKYGNELVHHEFIYTDNREDFLALLEKWNRYGNLESLTKWTYEEE